MVKEALGLVWAGVREISASGVLRALSDLRKKAIFQFNLHFSYDRVVRVGPAGPALFYYLKGLGLMRPGT